MRQISMYEMLLSRLEARRNLAVGAARQRLTDEIRQMKQRINELRMAAGSRRIRSLDQHVTTFSSREAQISAAMRRIEELREQANRIEISSFLRRGFLDRIAHFEKLIENLKLDT